MQDVFSTFFRLQKFTQFIMAFNPAVRHAARGTTSCNFRPGTILCILSMALSKQSCVRQANIYVISARSITQLLNNCLGEVLRRSNMQILQATSQIYLVLAAGSSPTERKAQYVTDLSVKTTPNGPLRTNVDGLVSYSYILSVTLSVTDRVR